MSIDPLPFPVSGAILAGGRSSRMGRDKAFLPWCGVSLVGHQSALLRSLGIDDLLISGRVGVNYEVPAARVVIDEIADAGPLGGLAALLAAAQYDWLLVIAVDLPHLTRAYLRTLLITGGGRIGIVPHGAHGFEPLVALYPTTLLPRIQSALARREFSLQPLLRAATDTGLMAALPIADSERALFANWNTPEDVSP